MKACIYTLGCRVNQYESDAIMQELKHLGVEIVSADREADVCVINTCSVTSESDRKSKQIIRRLISKNPSAKVIVTGCFSQINPTKAAEIPGVSLVVGNNDKSLIAKKAIELYSSDTQSCQIIQSDVMNGKFDVMCVGAPLTRTRAFIKIQDGCDSRCAYCIIPKARGSVRSNSMENILAEAKTVVSQGCCEIVFTGIETAAYGKDLKNRHALGDLLKKSNEIEGLERIRLGSLDPAAITREFVDSIKNLSKIAPHFHISMQSGCTKTLNEMKRKYNIDMARENISRLRDAFPTVMLSADVITGFPGESDEDFEATLSFFEEQKFLHLHIFPYSKRAGTPAAEMKNQVPEEIKKERLHRLEAQQRRIKAGLLDAFVSATDKVSVLFETFDGEYVSGHTPNFIEVFAKGEPSMCGKIFEVKPTHTNGDIVYGEIV